QKSFFTRHTRTGRGDVKRLTSPPFGRDLSTRSSALRSSSRDGMRSRRNSPRSLTLSLDLFFITISRSGTEDSLQPRPHAKQLHRNGSTRGTEQFRDLDIAVIVDVAKHQNLCGVRSELRQCIIEPAVKLVVEARPSSGVRIF